MNRELEYPLEALTVDDVRWLRFAEADYKVDLDDAGAQLWEDLLCDEYGRTVWQGGHIQMEINLLKAAVAKGGRLYDPDYDPRSYDGPLRAICDANVIKGFVTGNRADHWKESYHA